MAYQNTYCKYKHMWLNRILTVNKMEKHIWLNRILTVNKKNIWLNGILTVNKSIYGLIEYLL